MIYYEEHNCIYAFLILMYKFNKDLKRKIDLKNKKEEKYNILNADFLNNLKQKYNYKLVCSELEKVKYKNDYEFDSKIDDLIKSIKKKRIINEFESLNNDKLVPDIRAKYSKKHFINFGLVNDKIFETISLIKKKFKLTGKLSKIEYTFYFSPQLFYSTDECIKIGIINQKDTFEMQYCINLDLYNYGKYSLINELKNVKTMKEFFQKKKIDINSKETHELTSYHQSQGQLINCNFFHPNYTGYNNFNFKKQIISNSFSTSVSPKEIPKKEDLSILDNFHIRNFTELQFTPMIGLQNIGQTCYMNAALQCFSNTKALTKYFLNYNKLDIIKNNTIIIYDSNEPSLVVEYLKLLRHLWCDTPKSNFAPYEFKEKIGKINPLFKDFEANDAKDFVNFMVMRMHEELNHIDGTLTKQNNLKEPVMPINPYNQSQVLESYLYEFQLNFDSFISNCFYGTTQGEFECQNCKMRMYQSGQNMPLIKYNYQTYFFLNFPLDEVRKYVLSNQMLYMKYMNQGVNPNLIIYLLDCFAYYQKDDLLSCYCERCQRNDSQVITRTKLFIAPIYLIILLNRGKGIEFNIKLTFPEEFDTTGIFINSNGIYQLYGVVKHFGENNSSGHFTAYCRSPIDGLWYFYNDATVTQVSEQEKYQIQEVGLTYMLFYKQKNSK